MNTPPVTQQVSRSSTLVPTTSEAFKKAIESFRKRLSPEELCQFTNTTHDQLLHELGQLQEKQERNKEMMNLRRLEPFLEGMLYLGKTIEVFLNASDVLCFVWGPIKFMLLTASAFNDTFDTLLDAYAQIGEHMPMLVEYESLFESNAHLLDALQWIYIDILSFHRRAIRFFEGSNIRRIFRAMWKNYDTEFKGTLQRLRRHKDLVEQRASIAQYRRHEEDMLLLQKKLDAQIKVEQEKKLIVVKEWLAVGQQTIDEHEGYREIRKQYSATAQWILDDTSVKQWKADAIPGTPLLWIHGIPGAGKTVLASAIIDACMQTSGFDTSYFYCHDGDQSTNSALSILKGLANLLLNQHVEDLLPAFHNGKATSGDASLRSLPTAQKLLEDCCSILPRVFLVVDGLDECEAAERKLALESLTKLVGDCNATKPGKLRVLVVSQYYSDIQRGLQSSGTAKVAPAIVQISEADNEGDIRTYVKIWVDKIASKNHSTESPFSEHMKEYLRNRTLVNAKGMFLYAKLVLENLYSLHTRGEVIDAIKHENFPQGLEQAYERIVSRIRKSPRPNDWKTAKRLLGWMVCAKRQLTWKEMQVALSIDTRHQTIDYDDRHLRIHIRDICGSLVLMVGDRVTLVHSTAKTYITRISRDIHEPSIEAELAILCLEYLTFPCFVVDEADDEQDLRDSMLTGHFAFQDYAVAKWFHHINAFVKNGQKYLDEAVAPNDYLDALSTALDDFLACYDDENWCENFVQDCQSTCSVFQNFTLYENLLRLTSHIYTFQQKGFDARHMVNIKSLETALMRNRKLLEDFPGKLTPNEKTAYCKFYDDKRRFKCTKITCRYFSQGFADAKAQKRHINIHDRPYQCEVSDCLGAEGFANEKDLKNHTRSFHPELSDLAEAFRSSPAKRAKADHACVFCGRTFTRKFHRVSHERSHRGERPYECPECGRAFTRKNDCERHKKLHERGR